MMWNRVKSCCYIKKLYHLLGRYLKTRFINSVVDITQHAVLPTISKSDHLPNLGKMENGLVLRLLLFYIEDSKHYRKQSPICTHIFSSTFILCLWDTHRYILPKNMSRCGLGPGDWAINHLISSWPTLPPNPLLGILLMLGIVYQGVHTLVCVVEYHLNTTQPAAVGLNIVIWCTYTVRRLPL